MFFWRRRIYLFDHVIFVLHSLSFMALFVALDVVALKLHLGSLVSGWLILVPPVHIFFHLKGAYGLGIFSALWRTVALSTIAICVLSAYVTAILILGMVD
jgi:hypothetical protein